MENPVLELKKITKKISKNFSLTDISLTSNSKEITAIISNDSHRKTILLRIIAGLIKPNLGSILLMSHDIRKEYKNAFNYMGYTEGLICKRPEMKVSEYLKYSNSFYKADYSDNITNLLSELEINPDSKISDLSVYEKKRLSIINIIFFNPKLIIIDNLYKDTDNLSKYLIKKVLNRLKGDGASIIYTDSNLTNSDIIDNAYILKNGKLLNDIDINKLKSYRYITITKKESNDKKLIDSNIYDLHESNNMISFIYKGNPSDILKKAENLDSSNVIITYPDVTQIPEFNIEETENEPEAV